MPYLSALEVFSRSAIQIHVYLYLVVVVAAVAAAAEGSVVGVTLIRGQSPAARLATEAIVRNGIHTYRFIELWQPRA